jgi:hypothetical protein
MQRSNHKSSTRSDKKKEIKTGRNKWYDGECAGVISKKTNHIKTRFAFKQLDLKLEKIWKI